jgi:hypothetical protein
MNYFSGVLFLAILAILSFTLRNFQFEKQGFSPAVNMIEESKKYRIIAKNNIPSDYFFKRLPYFSFRFLFFSPGIVVSDFNSDGYMDFFVPNSSSRKKQFLFINKKGKGFSEESEKWGIRPLNQDSFNISGAPIDFDNDGDMDLIVTRLAGCTLLYQNIGNKFEEVSKKYQLNDCSSSQMVLPYDFNSDGHLDLFFIKYWGKITNIDDINEDTFRVENYINAKNGGINSLHLFDGKKFTDSGLDWGLKNSYWSFDATLLDLDNDDKMEIYVANDFGPDQIYKIMNGKLKNVTKNWKGPDRRNGMNASHFYPLNSSFPNIFVSNIYLKNYMQRGNFFWKSNGKNLKDQAIPKGISNCGWSWGSVFGDFNLDGLEDLYIGNGMITSKLDPSNNIETPAVMRSLPVDLFKNFDALFFYNKNRTLNKSEQALEEIIRGSIDRKTRSFSGNQRDCFFIQNRGKFTNASNKIKGHQAWDARGVAIIDIENDGRLDLIISVQGGDLKLLKNYPLRNQGNKQNWVGFSLQKELIPSSSFGTKLVVTQNDTVYRKIYLGGKSGFMTFSDPRVHFGLQTNDKINLELIYPSGMIIKKENLETGKYHTINEF